MKDLILKNKSILAVFAMLIVFAINSKILLLNLNNDFLGILGSLFLFVIGSRKTDFKINYFLIVILLLLEFISYRLNTKSVHFLAVILLLCLVYYYFTGKFSFIAFICLILFSTLFSAFFAHLTSEIKQGLCYIVYLTLKNFIVIDKIEGVNFYINNAKITIDTACMGLSMFKTGLLSGAILMTLEERKQKLHYGVFQILIFCILIIVLNIVSNYFRIITLVILNCTQENTLHHTIGLICFTLYQIIPMLVIIKYIKPRLIDHNLSEIKPKAIIALVSFLVVLVTSIKIKNENVHNFRQDFNSKYDAKKGVWVNNEVFKMEKDNQNYNSYWWYECDHKKYTSIVEILFIKLIYNQPIFLVNEIQKSN